MSFSIAFGSTRSSTNWRTVACTSRCSGLSSKSTGRSLGRVLFSAFAQAFAAALGLAGPPAPDPAASLSPLAKARLVVVSGLPAPAGVGGVIVQRSSLGEPHPANTLVVVDQEGGDASAFADAPPLWVAAAYTAEAEALAAGRATGRALRQRGVDVDLAPVLDAPTGPLGSRHFRRPELGLAFARGLAAGGVAACVKHFPGLGSAATSTDLRPYVPARLLPSRAAGLPRRGGRRRPVRDDEPRGLPRVRAAPRHGLAGRVRDAPGLGLRRRRDHRFAERDLERRLVGAVGRRCSARGRRPAALHEPRPRPQGDPRAPSPRPSRRAGRALLGGSSSSGRREVWRRPELGRVARSMRAEVDVRPVRERRRARRLAALRGLPWKEIGLWGGATVLFLLLATGVVFAGSPGHIPAGVQIEGVKVSGQEPAAAASLLEDKAADYADKPVTFTADGDEYHLTPAELDATVDWEALAVEAEAKGDWPMPFRGLKRVVPAAVRERRRGAGRGLRAAPGARARRDREVGGQPGPRRVDRARRARAEDRRRA